MKNQFLVITLILAAFAVVVITQINSDSKQSIPTGFQVNATQFHAASTEDLAELRAHMTKFRTAAHAGDVETIVSLHSDKFASEDATGKDGVRELWTMIIDIGFASKLELDLETAVITVDFDKAEMRIFDDYGDIELAFNFAKEEGKGWLITGTPPEDNSVSYDLYLEPHGDGCVEHGDYFRCWDIFSPEIKTDSMPLVIDLHGYTNSPERQRDMSGFESLAASHGFIVAWPYGIGKSWNAGEQCCGVAVSDGIDDVGFFRKLIEQVSMQYPVDPQRIYVTGLSNGCSMAQRLAAEASDVVAAAACMSLHLLVPPAQDYSPVPVMILYGTRDKDIYAPEEGELPSAEENFLNWGRINRCVGPAIETLASMGVLAMTYRQCAAETEISMVAIEGGVHVLYKGMQSDVDTTQIAWDFLKRFSQPTATSLPGK